MPSSDMLHLALACAIPVGTALLPYWLIERYFRMLWAGSPLPRVLVSAAPYRGATVVPGHTQKAPGSVRLAAFTSFFLGQMFLPGLLMGLVGLFIMGIGLVAIPGLVVAARLWFAGIHLLKGTPESIGKARSAARWSVQLNALLTIVCVAGGIFALFVWGLTDRASMPSDLESLLCLLGFTQAYALVSLGQAALIARATKGLLSDEDLRAEDVLPRWIRAAIERRDVRRLQRI